MHQADINLFYSCFYSLGLDSRDKGFAALAEYVVNTYAEPGRHYHDFGHIGKMLNVLDQYLPEADSLDALRIAILFHDLRQGHKHERESASMAGILLKPFNHVLGRMLINRVAELILDTVHPGNPTTNDGQLIHDIDLYGFGQSFEECRDASRGIRLEYADMNDEDFYQAQKGFFEHLLSQDSIYKHPSFAIFEDKARNNLKKLIKILPILSIMP